MLVPGQELLDYAISRHCAVGSFNTYNIEVTNAIIRAAEARQAPVFLAIGSGALDYAGFEALTAASLAAARGAAVPVALHLDHSPDVPTVSRCVGAGFTSVMIDGSRLPLEANIALTRGAIAASANATVEAELGGIAGEEDRSGNQTTAIPMTDPVDAARLVSETGVASLAIAIGNAHGVYAGEPHLDFDRLRALADLPVPLVLHGASGIGGDDLRHCIKLGVRKINVNTELRIAFFESLAESLQRGVKGYDVTRLLGAAVEAMQRVVEEKLAVFAGS